MQKLVGGLMDSNYPFQVMLAVMQTVNQISKLASSCVLISSCTLSSLRANNNHFSADMLCVTTK